MPATDAPPTDDGLVVVVKRDCPTCTTILPVLRGMKQRGVRLRVLVQDDVTAFADLDALDDTSLEASYRLQLTTVPTLIRFAAGAERERTEGWDRSAWQRITGLDDLGRDLPAFRPGCGSKSLEPGIAEELIARFGGVLRSRRLHAAELEDEAEFLFEQGWTDGLPVVPPTPARVVRMLEGTTRRPDDVVCLVPPDLVACTVEKVAINAVMAGCRPEYLPVVLAALEAACTDEFNMHGLLATTWFAGPVLLVNGPVTKAIGMNSGVNCLGQGNRANATIGRALQLVVRNVGGGRPDEVDRATLGNPGKYTFCFAEREDDSPWESLATERLGLTPDRSAVTVFGGSGVQGIADQLSRTPESLSRSFAGCLRANFHPKFVLASDAILVVSPEHARVFREAGWTKARLRQELEQLLMIPGTELVRGAGGIAEGIPEHLAGATLPKFRPGGLMIVHAGGNAGLFSAIIGGWVSGAVGSEPATKEIRP